MNRLTRVVGQPFAPQLSGRASWLVPQRRSRMHGDCQRGRATPPWRTMPTCTSPASDPARSLPIPNFGFCALTTNRSDTAPDMRQRHPAGHSKPCFPVLPSPPASDSDDDVAIGRRDCPVRSGLRLISTPTAVVVSARQPEPAGRAAPVCFRWGMASARGAPPATAAVGLSD